MLEVSNLVYVKRFLLLISILEVLVFVKMWMINIRNETQQLSLLSSLVSADFDQKNKPVICFKKITVTLLLVVSPNIMRAFGLKGGSPHLSLNCVLLCYIYIYMWPGGWWILCLN